MPYLVPKAAKVLEEIGCAFADSVMAHGGSQYRIVVTSCTRSYYTVGKLLRVNRNASPTSCHMYGTTFDLSWTHYEPYNNDFRINREDLKNILGHVLLDFQLKKRCTVFLLSDFFDPKDYANQLTIANSRHDVVALQIYDRRMVELPDVGIVKMLDAETGKDVFVDTSSSAVRRVHHEWWVTHQAWLKTAFTKSNIDNISVRTDEDYVKALMNLFRKRA
jgi:hypothetical protein